MLKGKKNKKFPRSIYIGQKWGKKWKKKIEKKKLKKKVEKNLL